MTQWLNERYISRVEHQKVVAYYKKLVVQLHGKVRELQAQAETPAHAAPPQFRQPPAGTDNRAIETGTVERKGNVIRVSFGWQAKQDAD